MTNKLDISNWATHSIQFFWHMRTCTHTIPIQWHTPQTQTQTHTHTHTHVTHTFFILYLHKSGPSRHMQSHKEQQSSSTCCQCGKIISRADNLAKHLRHCTGHRPPPPQLPQQQQQQHASAQQPSKLSIHHQYTSMQRYNINMQETQHLDHRSTALHLLIWTITQFHTKHHAYKFQVAITIVCRR